MPDERKLQDNVGMSKLTKVLVHKTHGGRKIGYKHWSKDEDVQTKDSRPDDKNSQTSTVVKSLLYFICFFLLLSPISYFAYTKYAKNPISINLEQSEHPKKNAPKAITTVNAGNTLPTQTKKVSSQRQEPKQLVFTEDQVNKAIQEVLDNKKPKGSGNENVKYEYTIELHNGAVIYTDNARMIGQEVTYNNGGLIISINRSEIKSLKRVRL